MLLNTWVYVAGFVMLMAVAGLGMAVGTTLHSWSDHDAIAEQVLGDAECLRLELHAPSPYGTSKFAEQVLCGYHLEWSKISGGVYPKDFAPQPDEHRLGG